MRGANRLRVAIVGCTLLLGACGADEDRREETELERNPTTEVNALDSAAAGTSIDTTAPLQPQEARSLDAGFQDTTSAAPTK